MRRREFIAFVVSTPLLPFAALAQQSMRRIVLLLPFAPDNPQARARLDSLLQGLQQLGWHDGRNVQIEARWAASNADLRKQAAELVVTPPDVLFTTGSVSMGILAQTPGASSIPTVFVVVPDPVGAGYVASLSRPGGNATGFMLFEYNIAGKWLELLREIMPDAKRAAVIRDPTVTAGIGQWAAIQAVAPSLGMDIVPVDVRDSGELERVAGDIARAGAGGLIVTGSFTAVGQRDFLTALAARHRLPAVYYDRFFATSGGLISYGPNLIDQFRRSADYVDRILKGEKPATMPVQAPTKFEMVVNLKTAKALGLAIPAGVLARADEVIE
jgi:putative ABC transport system substrate-binding protein